MSIARHHAEWLSLVPVSGPFLSLPVLMEAFPQGLDAHDAEHARLLRLAYEEWDDATGAGDQRRGTRKSSHHDPRTVHHDFIKFVLTKSLEYDESLLAEGQAIAQTLQVEVPEHGELLRPSIVLNDPATNKARMLIQTYPRSQNLSSYVAGSRWKASPDTRMTDLLHGTGVRLGLVTNGEHWMLVDAPKGETTGYASWYASLWREEKVTLQAFRSLLSMPRLFGVADDQTLDALLSKSASNQQEVTDQLGFQVRRAVEVLIQSLDKADQDHGRELLAGVSEAALYESALTVMMRLVFLFCAEERGLIPSKPFPVYEQNYSVSTISKQLRELADQHGEELLERRYDAWPRLLVAFRAVYGGLRHDDVHIPAYGGKLFNPDRFPFLEGRKQGTSWRETEAKPLPVNNRTVLHLLEALQLLQIKVPGGGGTTARRVSFQHLGIEQIGHVYEGLLDHTAKRAAEPFLGLSGTRSKEPEISLAELEKLSAKGEDDLVKHLKDETGKSVSALKKSLKIELDTQTAARFRTACQSDNALWKRVMPLAGLVRQDNFGYPVVIPSGSVFVTAGTDRRSSGTHYTPLELTEPIVQYTLEPLVYVGPAEGKPKNEWKLKSAKELLDLKICDMACGSGAFLVQVCRYLAARLLEAWEEIERASPESVRITPQGNPSTGKPDELLIPEDPEERKLYAMRIVAQRCLYGVDINPLAVEMAKLSLWLLTMAKDKPFEFLDHNIRCGDSLIGLHSIDQLRHFSLKPDADDAVLFGGPFEEAVEQAIGLRLKLADMPSNTVDDIKDQEKLLKEADDKIARLRCAADLLVSAEFWGENPKDKQENVRHAAVVAGQYVEHGPTDEFQARANKERRGQKMFHWPLEFPEVIVKQDGFDAFVGNPPFIGGKRISGLLGNSFRNFLIEHVSGGQPGNCDICAYFFLRASAVLRNRGTLGLLATNTIAQGDTRDVGLSSLIHAGHSVFRATKSRKWPGYATVEISEVWVAKCNWLGLSSLDGRSVKGITPYLTEIGDDDQVASTPERLATHPFGAYIGYLVNGIGFVVETQEAETLFAADSKNRNVLLPYINGQNVNSSPTQSPNRHVIYFREWPMTRRASHPIEAEKASEGYSGPVADDYPQCLEIIRQRVKPARDALPDYKRRVRDRWWLFEHVAPGLEAAVGHLTHMLVRARVANINSIVLLPTNVVPSEQIVVFASDSMKDFAVLQSFAHTEWLNYNSSSLRTDVRYTPSDCFETFVFPKQHGNCDGIGWECYEHRRKVMTCRQLGLTKTYNRFHDPDENSADMQRLRDLHVDMDRAVAVAYDWGDLDLGHGFYETKQGLRFTISEPARREVLQRLLKLNHERYAEEVKQGLHDKKKGKAKKAIAPKKSRKAQPAVPMLFGEDGDEGG